MPKQCGPSLVDTPRQDVGSFGEKSSNTVRQRLVDEGRIIVHDTRVEVINPYGEHTSWKDYVTKVINEYEHKQP